MNRLALLAAVLLLAVAPARAARSDWREMTVGHFHLYSTLRDSATRDIARQLQTFEQTVGRILQSDDRLPDVPTLIYILDQKDFQKYAVDRPGLGGFFHEGPASNTLVINGEMDFDAVKITVFHEYTHFIQRNTRTLRLPPWYAEGYAELFSSFRISKDVITLGELPRGVQMSLEHRDWIPMERLLAVKQSDREYRTENLMPQFYGEAWALVHLLLFDDKTLTAPTEGYLGDVDVGFPEPEAFTKAFPFDKAGLDAAVLKLIRGGIIHLKRYTFLNPVEVDQAPITKLTVAQADTAMARLTFMLGRPPEVVGPLILAALSESPAESPILALSARIAARTQDKPDLQILTTLAADETIGAQGRIDIADALMADGGSTESGKVAFGVLDGLVHAADPPIEAVLLWTRAAELGDVPPRRLIEVLEPASRRAPHNTQLLQQLAISNERIGEKAKARGFYTRVILVSQFEQERAFAQKQADSERLQDKPPSSAAPDRPVKPPLKPGEKPPVKH